MRSAQNVASLPATATDLTPADPERIGPYRPLKRLGAGGMGVVYAAHDAAGGLVAVKLIHPEYSADPDFRARFAREVELLHRVGGACAVPLLAADTAAERPWLVTPLVRGLTLGDYVREHGPLPERLLLGLAAGVAEALVRIHAVGIAHRDLKPANVVLSPEGPRVLDFGVARAVDQTALTRTGSIVGSPGWISPDHYRGRPASTADDVFAWGALMAFAATGRQPFGTGDPAVVAHRVISGEPDMDGFTGPLADLARWALAKEAGQRPDAMRLVEAVFALSGPGRGRPPAGTPEAVDGAMATVVDENWQGVPAAPEQVFAIAPRPGGGRAKRGLAVAGAVVGALLLLAGATFGGVVLARSWDTQVVADDVPAEEAGTGGDRRPGAGNEPKPSESPSGEPSESPSEEAEAGDGGGEEEEGGGTSATSTGLVGAGVAAAGARPSGEHVVAFQPDGGAAVYARLDGADVVCAWSFCQSQGGSVGNGSAGSVPSSPSALTGYANQGGRTVRAEVTYTTADDGTVTITRLVEQHRTSGTGTPPW